MTDAQYLAATPVLDADHPDIRALADRLRSDHPAETAERAFIWVRDQVLHSSDYKKNPVTCRASDVLRHRTGYCYAKAHLLVALLRAAGIPAGLAYQRLSIDGAGPPYCLHGLAAVWLAGNGWRRIDPRGNKPGVDAQFSLSEDALAFPITAPGERDLPGVYAAPIPVVVEVLTTHQTWDAVLANLPDEPSAPTANAR